MIKTKNQPILERIVINHLCQLEDKKQPIEYKKVLFYYTLKFLRKSERNVWAGGCMSRIYSISETLDKTYGKDWREIK